jgi:hypothetical protein
LLLLFSHTLVILDLETKLNGGIPMKVFGIIVKIAVALAAVAGIVYLAATYGDRVVAWAKGLLKGKCCCCGGECTCEEGECTCDECECDDEEITVEVVETEPVAAEGDFEG